MDQDQEIVRMLRALGAVEPPAGLEERVLLRLEARKVASTRTAPLAWWLVAAAVAVVALFFTGRVRLAARPKPTASVQGNQPMARLQQALALPEEPSAQGLARPRRTSLRRPAPLTATPLQTAKLGDRGLADLPSQLAPPAALTVQERQLTQIARGPERHDLAFLDEPTRERLAQQSAAEFKQFFPPPTPQEIYLATHVLN